ncbi:MAG: exo-alpha-sialidase [Vitreoscilla sp.]|nr:exo-alpha-sialidase [Vitreoscilla sp.]
MSNRAWVATRKGLFELQRGAGGAWRIARSSFLGEPVSAVLPPATQGPQAGRMLAALNLGHWGVKMQASDDAGQTWAEVATPQYPPQPPRPEGEAAPLNFAGRAEAEWKLVMVWTLQAAHGTLWAGTLPGGLFRSADLGRSWQLVEPLWQRPERLEWFGGGYDVPGIHSICPHPQRTGEMLLGLSCGGVWRSADDAAHWQLSGAGMRADFMPPERADDQNIQDPHCIVRCAAEPDKLWCQHHNGIWRSVDDGRRWQRITTAPVSDFGFAVAVHPQHGDTAWFVPAKADQCRVPPDGAMVVQRTRDGGQSFEVLRQGLPQQDCHDLVYRHGLAVSADGRNLLMGSTTGHLWSSDDAGDTWQLAQAHLPPIAAVSLG